MAWGIGRGMRCSCLPSRFASLQRRLWSLAGQSRCLWMEEDTFNMDPESLLEAIARVDREGRLRKRA